MQSGSVDIISMKACCPKVSSSQGRPGRVDGVHGIHGVDGIGWGIDVCAFSKWQPAQVFYSGLESKSSISPSVLQSIHHGSSHLSHFSYFSPLPFHAWGIAVAQSCLAGAGFAPFLKRGLFGIRSSSAPSLALPDIEECSILRHVAPRCL